MAESPSIDLANIFASTVHDVKNSLGFVTNLLDDLAEKETDAVEPVRDLIGQLHYETRRLSGVLVQLLAVYRAERMEYHVNVDHEDVGEVLEEIVLQHQPMCGFRGIELAYDCPEDLHWFFDREIVATVLGNAINNGVRYTRGRILISAETEDPYLVLTVADDGAGYPERMLGVVKDVTEAAPRLSEGSTGLGLYFAALAVQVHENNGRRGEIRLENGGPLGGGRFRVLLP